MDQRAPPMVTHGFVLKNRDETCGTEAETATTLPSAISYKKIWEISNCSAVLTKCERNSLELGRFLSRYEEEFLPAVTCLEYQWHVDIFLTFTEPIMETDGGYGYSALHAAVISHDLQKLTTLMTEGYNPDVRDAMDFAPLHVATLKGSKDVVEVLVAAGCDINAFTKEEMTSLHLAAECKGAIGILSVLVSACDVNARNKVGRTALHLAAKRGHLPHLRTLLDSGCDRGLKDKFGITALGVAMKCGQSECVDFLLHYEPRKKSEEEEKVVEKRNDANSNVGEEDLGLARFGSRKNCKIRAGDDTENSIGDDAEDGTGDDIGNGTDNDTGNRTGNDIAEKGQSGDLPSAAARHSVDCACAQRGATETIRKAKQVIVRPKRNGAKAGISKELLHLIQALVSWKRDTLDNTLNHGRLCVACKVSPNTYFVESKLLDGVLELLSTQAPFVAASSLQRLFPGPLQTSLKLKDSRASAAQSTLCLRDLQRNSGGENHLVVLLSGMRKSMDSHFRPSNHLPRTKEHRRSFSLPSNWKSQRDHSLYDIDDFAEVFVRLCMRASTHPKSVEKILDSMFATVFFEKLFGVDVLAEALLKQIAVASAASEEAECRKASAELNDFLAGVISNLEYVINADYAPGNFSEAIFGALVNQFEILNFVLDKRLTFFRLLMVKTLEDETRQWNTDKTISMFLRICDKTKLDRSLLVKVGRAIFSQALTQPCCNGLSLVTGILIRMGLLKGEGCACVDTVQDLSAPLIVLEHMFQEDFFPRTLAAVFASFLAKPNQLFCKVQELRLRALKAAVLKETLPETADEACEAFGKGFKRVCDTLAPEGFWEVAKDCCDELASKAWEEPNSQAWRAAESLLVSLGLIKSETETEPVRNTRNALKLLKHVASQPYFPQLLVPMFRLFLQKPNPRLEPCQKNVDDVLKSLQDK